MQSSVHGIAEADSGRWRPSPSPPRSPGAGPHNFEIDLHSSRSDSDEFSRPGLTRPSAPAGLAPEVELSNVLTVLRRHHPETNLAGLLLSEVRRKLWRNALTVGPTVGGFFLGFIVGQGLCSQAGFQRLAPIVSHPFNPRGEDHRGQGSALVAWALAAGIAGSIALSTVGFYVGAAVQRAVRPHPQRPRSPVADCLASEAQALVSGHRRVVVPAAICGLIGFIAPQSLANQAGFNLNFSLVAKPFNPGGHVNRTLSAALLAYGLAASLIGLAVGASLGVGIGRATRRLWPEAR